MREQRAGGEEAKKLPTVVRRAAHRGGFYK
jgi:hypothetical protein